MPESNAEHTNPATVHIRRRIHYLNVTAGIVVVLFIVLFLHAFRLVLPFSNYITPETAEVLVPLILAGICVITVAGLYMAIRLSKESARIISDYNIRYERMVNITRDLREEVYGDILLDKIMDYALAITESEAGSLLLLNDEKKLVFRIVRGEKASQLLGTAIESGSGIAGRVALEGRPVRIADVKNNAGFNPALDAVTGFETKSILCVPIKTKTGIVGVLELLNKRGGYAYRPRDEEITCYLAEQAASSILRARFLEDHRNYEIHLTDLLLETIDFQQPEKRGHALRVARYSNVIAKALDMPEHEKKRLYLASLLHDVGFLKIKIDEAFEKEVHMQHSVIGYEIIKPITFYADITPFILYHHKRYDGYGYPSSNIKGEEIPLGARIIAIAEAFDVMINPLSYKVPIGFDDAIEELRQKSGSQFDPRLVDIFTENITLEHTR
jgi:putative methionine-R-sulfoxide reductase with GAF domain